MFYTAEQGSARPKILVPNQKSDEGMPTSSLKKMFCRNFPSYVRVSTETSQLNTTKSFSPHKDERNSPVSTISLLSSNYSHLTTLCANDLLNFLQVCKNDQNTYKMRILFHFVLLLFYYSGKSSPVRQPF